MQTLDSLVMLLVAALGIHQINAENEQEDIIIANSDSGPVRGEIATSHGGTRYYAFRGIPYARPPLGPLRFKPPEPPESWTEVRLADKDGPICPQFNLINFIFEGEEDCLFLNVYSKQLQTPNNSTKLDVMVWIHGGAFELGTGGELWYGPQFLMDQDIVLVTPNYRLGALGFLSTEDAASPGNYGLKDQVQSLKWVQQNIAAFGGNAGSVTIFGESAGAAAVHFHMMSPLSKGLFHKAISQSGTALCPWSMAKNPKLKAEELGTIVNCSSQNTDQLVACLRNVDRFKLLEATNELRSKRAYDFIMFAPVVEPEGEHVFLAENPRDLLTRGDFHQLPWITGLNTHEGAFGALALSFPGMARKYDRHFETEAPLLFGYESGTEKSREITQRVRSFYFGNQSIGQETVYNMIDLASDVFFRYGAHQAVKIQSRKSESPLYFYQLSFQGRLSFFQLMEIENIKGVSHADDLLYLFHIQAFQNNYTDGEPEMKTTERMVKMWTDFAKTGQPTSSISDLLPIMWNPVQPDNEQYLDIGAEMTTGTNLEKERVEFWESILNSD